MTLPQEVLPVARAGGEGHRVRAAGGESWLSPPAAAIISPE